MHTSSNEVHERRYKVRLRINLVWSGFVDRVF